MKAVTTADECRGIYSERAVKSSHKKLTNYAGLESENFALFKDQFTEAAKDNRVPKSDQADKLREVLTGMALQHMPKSCKNIDDAWAALNGNPRTLLNHKLKKVRGMHCLTDALLQSDPSYTATWYLDF